MANTFTEDKLRGKQILFINDEDDRQEQIERASRNVFRQDRVSKHNTLDSVIDWLSEDNDCEVLFWHLSVLRRDFKKQEQEEQEEQELIEDAMGEIVKVCLPKYRIAVSNSGDLRRTAVKAKIDYKGEKIHCFQIVKDWSHFCKKENYEKDFIMGLLACIHEIENFEPCNKFSNHIINVLAPLRLNLDALKSGAEQSKHVVNLFEKCKEETSRIPEAVEKLRRFYPPEKIDYIIEVSKEACDICKAITGDKKKAITNTQIEKLLDDIDEMGNILREKVQEISSIIQY